MRELASSAANWMAPQLLGQTMAEIHMNYLPLFHIYAYSEIAMICALTVRSSVTLGASGLITSILAFKLK